MADASASCSIPCTITGLCSSTLTLSMRTSKQFETRAGVNSASVGVVERNFRVDKRMPLSNDVWSIHEMHCESKIVVCWFS